MNMNGAGLAMCPDAPPGPPMFQNIPAGFVWTLDDNRLNGVNAASPGMGLHAVDPAEFAPTRSRKEPYTLMLNYDSDVIGNHVLIWSGIANGEGSDIVPFTKETPTYNCQTDDKAFFPTTTMVDYDEETGRTSVKIVGPLADSSGESYTEVISSTPEPTGAPTPEPECLENGYEVWQTRDNEDVDLALSAAVNTESCSYELSLSFKPDEVSDFNQSCCRVRFLRHV